MKLTFAALAAIGPKIRAPKPHHKNSKKVCAECEKARWRKSFLEGSDVCQVCEAASKLAVTAAKKAAVKGGNHGL